MIKIKDYTQPEEVIDPNQNPLLPIHPFRMLISAGSGSGKTNLLLNLIYDLLYFDALYICAKDIFEPKYEKLQSDYTQFNDVELEDLLGVCKKKEREKMSQLYQKFKKETLFVSNQDDMIDVDSLDKSMKNLVVFDDCITDKDQSKILEFFFRARKKNASIIYISQSYYSTPIDIRKNCEYFVFFKLQNRDVMSIIRDIDGSIDPNEFKKIYYKAVQKKYDFLVLDLKSEQRYRRNFNPI